MLSLLCLPSLLLAHLHAVALPIFWFPRPLAGCYAILLLAPDVFGSVESHKSAITVFPFCSGQKTAGRHVANLIPPMHHNYSHVYAPHSTRMMCTHVKNMSMSNKSHDGCRSSGRESLQATPLNEPYFLSPTHSICLEVHDNGSPSDTRNCSRLERGGSTGP